MSNAWCLELASRITLLSPPRIRILEVGALDVNGSPQAILRPFASEYIGTDMRAGRGVDQEIPAEHLLQVYGASSIDAVVSTEMLEHCSDWPSAVRNMVGVLKPRGLLVVTARSPGFGVHDYPADCWRFTIDDFAYIFGAVGNFLSLEADPTGWPGVGILLRKDAAADSDRLDEQLQERLALRKVFNLKLDKPCTFAELREAPQDTQEQL